MATFYQSLTFDDVLATSTNNHRPAMTDNLYRSSALLNALKQKNRMVVDGGPRFIEPVLVTRPTGFASYRGTDVLPTSINQKFDAAAFELRQVGGTIGVDGTSELANAGKNGKIRLVTAALDAATKELSDVLNTMLYGNGQANAGKDWNGLQLIVSDGTPAENVGGLSETTYTAWQNVRPATITTFGTSLTAAASGYYGMQDIFTQLTDGSDQPDLILTGRQPWLSYANVLQPDVRYGDETDAVWRGWTKVRFMGIPVIMDRNAVGDYTSRPARMYFLNTKYLRLWIHADRNFVTEPWQKPINQDARFAKLLVAGNLAVSNRRMQGVLRIEG